MQKVQKKQQMVVTSQDAPVESSEWQNQNVIDSEVLNESDKELSQTTDSLLEGQIPSRILDLMSGTQTVSASNTDVVDIINPYMPVVQVKSLPSQFTPYKLLVKNPEIQYKPYKYGEIKKMNQSKMSVKQLFKEVLNGIICNFDKELLTLSDFMFIGLLRRISTLRSAKFNANFSCQVCNHSNKEEFDNSSLEFQDLNCQLPIFVTFDEKEYKFTPITVKDYLILYELDKLEDQIAFFAIQCRNTDIVTNYPEFDENGVKLTEEQRRFYTIYDIFYNLSSQEDGEVLDEIEKYLDHGLKPVPMKCKGIVEYTDDEGIVRENRCDNVINVTLSGGGVLITPFRESDEPIKSRIRFGS